MKASRPRGRSLPGWVCGLSIFATYLSSISYLALPGKSFAGNWNPFVFSISIPIATWIAVKWFLPYYRASGEVSAYAMLEHRFGVWARLYASVFYLLTQIARMGVVMYLMALPMGGHLRLGYSVDHHHHGDLRDGLFIRRWNHRCHLGRDAIQAIVLMVGAVICLTVMMLGVDGGPVTVVSEAFQAGKFSLGKLGAGVSPDGLFWFDATSATVLVVLLYGLFINLQNFGIDQSYIQRYIASESDTAARRSLWLAGWLYVPVSAVFFLIGTTLFVYYHAETNTEDLQQVKQLVARQRLMQDGVYPEFEPDASGQDAPGGRLCRTSGSGGGHTRRYGDRRSGLSPFHCQAPSAGPDGFAGSSRVCRGDEHRLDQPQLVRHTAHE